MTAIYLVVLEMPWWVAVCLYFGCSVALAIGVGQLLRRNSASYPVPEREIPRSVETAPHRPTW